MFKINRKLKDVPDSSGFSTSQVKVRNCFGMRGNPGGTPLSSFEALATFFVIILLGFDSIDKFFTFDSSS